MVGLYRVINEGSTEMMQFYEAEGFQASYAEKLNSVAEVIKPCLSAR